MFGTGAEEYYLGDPVLLGDLFYGRRDVKIQELTN